MNRAERRRFKKYGNVNGEQPTKTLEDFLHLYSLSFVVALDSVNIDKNTVLEIMQKVQETADCLDKGYINQHDVETMCNESYGINFVRDFKRNMFRVKDDGTLIGG